MIFDLIIFDLDGTLLDTRDAIASTFRGTLAAAGVSPPPAEQVHPLIGLPLGVMFRRYVPGEAPAELIDALVASYRRRYRAEVMPRTKPFPEVTATLHRLRQAGVLLAIATGKAESVAREAVAAAGLGGIFDPILGADSVERPKPAPDLVLRVLAEAGVRSSRALVVGDSLLDVAMGRAAGVPTCAVTYGVQTRAELAGGEPDFLIDRFGEVLRIAGLPVAGMPEEVTRAAGGAGAGPD